MVGFLNAPELAPETFTMRSRVRSREQQDASASVLCKTVDHRQASVWKPTPTNCLILENASGRPCST